MPNKVVPFHVPPTNLLVNNYVGENEPQPDDSSIDTISNLSTTTNYGVPRKVFSRLREVAEDNDCTIIIRTTNIGVIHGIEHGYVAGKPLMCKPKSSNALFLEATLPLAPYLAKNYPLAQGGNIQEFEKAAQDAKKSLFEDEFKQGTFDEINAYVVLERTKKWKIAQKDGYDTKLKNAKGEVVGDRLFFRVKTLNGTTCLISKNEFEKPSKDSTVGLKLKYLLKEVSEKDIKRVKTPPVDKSKGQKLYQVYLHSADTNFLNFHKSGDITNPSICERERITVGSDEYFPAKIIGEKCDWGENESDQGKYFPLVADYDLFGIIPNSPKPEFSIDEPENIYFEQFDNYRYYAPQYEQIKNVDKWIDYGYDSSLDAIMDKTKLHRHLGIISPFENFIRMEINKALGIPIARHGCEVNNLLYTTPSDEIVKLVEINRDFEKNSNGSYNRSSLRKTYENPNLMCNPMWFTNSDDHPNCVMKGYKGAHIKCWQNKHNAVDIDSLNFFMKYYAGLGESISGLIDEIGRSQGNKEKIEKLTNIKVFLTDNWFNSLDLSDRLPFLTKEFKQLEQKHSADKHLEEVLQKENEAILRASLEISKINRDLKSKESKDL